jgi:hypothetical protein
VSNASRRLFGLQGKGSAFPAQRTDPTNVSTALLAGHSRERKDVVEHFLRVEDEEDEIRGNRYLIDPGYSGPGDR